MPIINNPDETVEIAIERVSCISNITRTAPGQLADRQLQIIVNSKIGTKLLNYLC